MKLKLEWPDLDFPPVNQYILMSAYDFYKLIEEKMDDLPSYRYRNHNISEGKSLLEVQQVMFSWDEDTE